MGQSSSKQYTKALPAALVYAAVFFCIPKGGLTAQEVSAREDVWPIDLETAPRPVAHAVATTGDIDVNGVLDDVAWADAQPINEFIQSQPNAGFPATEPTTVRVLYDDANLYIGAICYDSDIEHRTVTTLEYGLPPSTRDMDIFAVTLDPFLDRRNSFIWLINPYGAYRDGQTFNDSRQADYAFRAPVTIKTTISDSAWTVEMAIPWKTLRFNPARDGQRWGMNLLRRVRRKNEDSYWAPVDRRDPVHRMSKAGYLQGLAGMRPGRNLMIKPYVLGTSVSGEQGITAEGEGFDWGGDVKVGLTPGLTLDATYRTDFSQVEVDQQRVNLTRFPLFFQEKRDFFVENSGSFVLGDVSERNYRQGSSTRRFTLFHSRRIGLESGVPVPVLAGGRVTGRAGAFEIGALTIQTEAVDSAAGENFAVFRLRRNLGASDIGVMFLNRESTGRYDTGDYNRAFAADANLRLLGNLVVNSYLARTEDPHQDGDQNAARIQMSWRDRIWDASAFVKHVGDAFNPEVGFVHRKSIRHGYATVGAHPRPGGSLVHEVNPYAELHYITDLGNVLQTRTATAGFGFLFADGSTLNLSYDNNFERLESPFTVYGNVIPVGDYRANTGSATFTSSRARPLSARLTVGGGDYWNGSRASVSGNVLWRASYRLNFGVDASHNDVSLPDGAFVTDVIGGRIQYFYSTALYASAYVQYNSAADLLVTNVRLTWIHAPLSDLFLVYTEHRDMLNNSVLDRVVTAKVTRSVAF